MIDWHKHIVTALSDILPTYYELTLTGDIKAPCISYTEANNYDEATGDTLGYSAVSYQVKVWATDMATIQVNALLVDAALRPLGFKRTSAAEFHDRISGMIQKIMIYEALGLENY